MTYTGRLSIQERRELKQLLEGGASVRAAATATGIGYGQVRGYAKYLEEAALPEPPHSPRMLVFDIENTPMLSWTWDYWQTNVIDVEQEWYMLCYAYAWYDLRTDSIGDIGFTSIYQDPNFKPDKPDDSFVVTKLWDLLDEADIVIGQNSKSFDVKKFNSRAVIHGMTPPSPFRQVDTKTAASDIGRFGSNSLKHLARMLGITLKDTNRGFDLWRECMAGDAKAWEEMEHYNMTDVKATAELYSRLRPWMTSRQHPNLGLYITAEGKVCTNCGNKEKDEGGKGFQYRGYHYTNASKFPQVRCNNCGGYSWEYSRVPQSKGKPSTVVDLR